MASIKFLIIAEINKTGFITEFRNSLEEAKTFAEELSCIGSLDSYTESEKIMNALKQKKYISYQIKGNQLYFGKVKYAITDAMYTVSVTEIDMKTFCLKTLIRERENHSIVFDGVLDDKLLEKFPQIDLIAN